MLPRTNYLYTEKEFDELGFKMLYALGELIVSDGLTVFGRGYARCLVRMENGNRRAVFWY
jgi:hypothetical protein